MTDNEHGLFDCVAGIVKPDTLNVTVTLCVSSFVWKFKWRCS